jgi:broad specificity phosphatase PhoE
MQKEDDKAENDQLLGSQEKLKTAPIEKALVRRRRLNGSPVLPLNLELPVKTVYMIRHAESEGQVAHLQGLDRKTAASLRDCNLTEKGRDQAHAISVRLSEERIELVLASPLTRALHTSLLGFPNKNILVHYDLREVGSRAPENVPREMSLVLQDLQAPLSHRDRSLVFDIATHQPSDWPRDYSPNVVKRDRIRRLFHWLYNERREITIAVVCHYNVIRSVVVDGEKLRPCNADPIKCYLYSNGEVVVATTYV